MRNPWGTEIRRRLESRGLSLQWSYSCSWGICSHHTNSFGLHSHLRIGEKTSARTNWWLEQRPWQEAGSSKRYTFYEMIDQEKSPQPIMEKTRKIICPNLGLQEKFSLGIHVITAVIWGSDLYHWHGHRSKAENKLVPGWKQFWEHIENKYSVEECTLISDLIGFAQIKIYKHTIQH